MAIKFWYFLYFKIKDVIYLWANSPPTVLPIEVLLFNLLVSLNCFCLLANIELGNDFYEPKVSDELYNDDADFTFQHAQASDCVGNYTIGITCLYDFTPTSFCRCLWLHSNRSTLPRTIFKWVVSGETCCSAICQN